MKADDVFVQRALLDEIERLRMLKTRLGMFIVGAIVGAAILAPAGAILMFYIATRFGGI